MSRKDEIVDMYNEAAVIYNKRRFGKRRGDTISDSEFEERSRIIVMLEEVEKWIERQIEIGAADDVLRKIYENATDVKGYLITYGIMKVDEITGELVLRD